MSSANKQEYLICPLTLELFNDPVIAEDGITYERKAIMEWIARHNTSPITGKPINIDRLTPNPEVKKAVETFNQQQTQDQVQSNAISNGNDNEGQNLENFDVLCRYCGSSQKLNNVKQHQLQCSSKPVNIVPFDIADNEVRCIHSPQTSANSKSSPYKNISSFTNPFADRSENPTTIEVPHAGNPTHSELSEENQFSLIKNNKIKCFLLVLLTLVLVAVGITLIAYYGQGQEKEPLTATLTTLVLASTMTSTTTTLTSTTSSISTSTTAMIFTPTSTMTSTSTSTSMVASTTISNSVPTLSSTPQSLCASAEWSSTGITVASNLYYPRDIVIDSYDNIIVADTENHRLQKYFTNGTIITFFPTTKAFNLFIDKFDNIYVADSFNDEVKILNSNGELLSTIDGSNITDSFYDNLIIDSQSGLYVDQNNAVYISDTGHHRVIKYFLNLNSGIVIAGEKGAGSQLDQLNGPYGLYVDEVHEIGAVYICDHQNRRIQKWLNGAKEGITVAIHNEQLEAPISILLQPTPDQMIMFISTFYGEHVLKWIPYAQEAESVVVGITNHMGTEADRLSSPRGIKFDKYWNLFVADSGNNRVQKFLFNTSSCETNN